MFCWEVWISTIRMKKVKPTLWTIYNRCSVCNYSSLNNVNVDGHFDFDINLVEDCDYDLLKTRAKLNNVNAAENNITSWMLIRMIKNNKHIKMIVSDTNQDKNILKWIQHGSLQIKIISLIRTEINKQSKQWQSSSCCSPVNVAGILYFSCKMFAVLNKFNIVGYQNRS